VGQCSQSVVRLLMAFPESYTANDSKTEQW